MSNKETLHLDVYMVSDDDRRLRIQINHDIKSDKLEVFVKAIEKAKDSCTKLDPLIQFLKNKEITFLSKNGWSIDDIEFSITKKEAIEYFENKKENGGTFLEAHSNLWPFVPVSIISHTFYELHIDGVVVPSRNVGENGGYVLKKYYKQNQDKARKSFKDYVSEPSSSKTNIVVEKQPKSKIEITKKEGKIIRADIIKKATCNDICEAGFRPEFVEKLPEKHHHYIVNLSNLQLKIMRTEVAKRCKS